MGMLRTKELKICCNTNMRNIAITLVVLALSIQTSFAAITSYCHHEPVAASHLAHYDHDSKSKETSNLSKSSDSDCSVCHLAHLFLIPLTANYVINVPEFIYPEYRSSYLRAISLDPPEKPNWLTLA